MSDHQLIRQVSKSLTPKGLESLGKLLQQSRLNLRDQDSGRVYGYRRLSALIKERTGVSVGKDTLQKLERGIVKQPSPDTMLALAGAQFIFDGEGNPYSVEDLLKIAAEEIFLNFEQIEAPVSTGVDDDEDRSPNS